MLFHRYFIALLRLLMAVFTVKMNRGKRLSVKSTVATLHPEYRFSLEDLRCPICARKPHKGLTKQLSAAARSKGTIQCAIHGPVQGEVLLSMGETVSERSAA